MTRSLDQALLQGADIAAMANTNLFVNGFMGISQEAGSTAAASNGRYPVDQFSCAYVAGALTSQQVSNPFPSMPEITSGVKLTVATASSPTASGDLNQLSQSIEGINLAQLRYGGANAVPVTVAFLLLPTFTGVIGWRLFSFASGKSWVKRIPVVAGQLQFVTFVIPGDTLAALGTGNTASFQAAWVFQAGANYQTATLEQWVASSSAAAPADITNNMATSGNALTIGACVMLPGRFTLTQDMLPRLQRRYEDELRLCQRYYETSYPAGYTPGSTGSGASGELSIAYRSDALLTFKVWFKQEKRTTPGMSGYASSGDGRQGSFYDYTQSGPNGNIGFANINSKGCQHYNASSSWTAGYTIGLHWVANARM